MALQLTICDYLAISAELKETPRRGWVSCGLASPEKVADHMYRVSHMCAIAPGFSEEVRRKAKDMAMVYSYGKAITGDILPSDNVSQEVRHTKDALAIKYIACTLRPFDPGFADELTSVFQEYEEGKTVVSQLVRQMDILETMHQALVYEETTGKDMSQIMDHKGEIRLQELQGWLHDILDQYKELKSRGDMNMTIVFVSGGPGVGKGTQCKRLVQDFGFCHISVGDLLREEAEHPDSVYKDFISDSITSSVPVPPQLTTALLKRSIQKARADGHDRFLLDGFPRTIPQAVHFRSKISKDYDTLVFDCSEEELMKRLAKRAESDAVDQKRRIDDSPEVIARRLRTFQENNLPVLNYLKEQGGARHEVDCSGSVDVVYGNVRSKIREILSLHD